MYERTCCKTSNAIATKRRTRARRIFSENTEHKCKCQNFQSRISPGNCDTVPNSNHRATSIQTNVNMQPQQQKQPQQQTTNKFLHFQMPTESTAAFMDEHTAPSEPAISSGRCTSPPSPSSISSLSSSESSTTAQAQATPSLGVNLRVTGQCSQGGRKYMEDYFSVAYQHSENAKDLEYAFFGIFDGHGGAEAATFAKEHLMMEIINQKLFWSDSDMDVLRAIREGYIATHFAMWREQDKWPKTANGLPSTAGTTATIAFIRHEKIYIGHVGDSGIVLGYQNDGEKCWRAKQLTIDHKPESMAERGRIMRSGGKVVVKSGVPRVVWNRPRNAGHRGPIRHNTPIDEIPFLAVARSLGDLWSYNSLSNEFVVSPDPDVRVIKINPKTFRCLIFGTDGLWNVVTPQESVNTVFHNETVNDRLQRQRGENLSNENGWMNPSKVLVDRALGTWSAKKMRADNTSVVTVILHPPNNHDSTGNATVMDNDSNVSKLDELYAQVGTAFMNLDTISYRDMAEKYLPPEEYRNLNYYDDGFECNGSSISNNVNKSYLDKRYVKSTANEQRYSLPNTLQPLEFMWDSREQIDRIAECSTEKETNDINIGMTEDDNDDTDEENWDDEDDEDNQDGDDNCDGDGNGNPIGVSNNDMIELNGFASQYVRDQQKEISQTTNEFTVNSCSLRSVDDTTTSSYMSTFAESYNTLLGDSVVSDAHMSADVSTSNSSNSYKSHSATCMQELVQEQQRYQQQCMSEEEGYSLTKLETRREQQRCNVTGVQTFRIFQQQQQQLQRHQQAQEQRNSNNAGMNAERTSSSDTSTTSPQNYAWEPRFPSAFCSNQRYQNYQPEQQQQQQQQQAHQFMLEQQLKSLELNSLLQQEREEEQQVEFERQMGMECFQQQQKNNSILGSDRSHSEDLEKPAMSTSDYLLVHGNDNANSEVLKSTLKDSSDSKERTEVDITIDEEYLLLDEDTEVDDASVQINEISSSSSLISSTSLQESDVPEKGSRINPLLSLKTQTRCSTSSTTPSCMFLTPMTSHSKLMESRYVDALEPTSEASFCDVIDIQKEPPKIIEKLEKIEILHEKPELVIESARTSSSIATRSKHKIKTIRETPSKRRCKSNVRTSLHFPNIPNENQHQQHPMQPTKTLNHSSLKNGMFQIRPVDNACEVQTLFNKRQLRSTSSTNLVSVSGAVGSSNSCNISSGNRKSCYSLQNSLNNNIDYVKRTLRTRNSLTKDLKAKTNLLSSGIKRSASAVTTRFLRTQAVNLLNIHQTQQVSGLTCKKPSSNSSLVSSPACMTRKTTQQPPQPTLPSTAQQRPLATTTFNFINLRSRQIGSSLVKNNTSGIASYSKQCTQTTTAPRKSLQMSNLTTSTATPATPNYVRRNLRSLNTMRPNSIKGKVTVSTSTNGLTNYCKSMRSSQSLTALVTPPPPSPKLLNPAAANMTIAVTRARTANVLMTGVASTKPLLLNDTIEIHNSRKRAMRSNQLNEHSNEMPILTVTRAQKRLRR